MADQTHPLAPHHLPFYITGPNDADVLMIVTGAFLVGTILWAGTLYWKLHSLPERMAHKSQKLQFEIVGVLGLLSLFTHIHLFWVIGLLLAMIDIPDFGSPLRSIAGSVEDIAASSRAPSQAAEADVGAQAEADAEAVKPNPPASLDGRGGHAHA